MVALWAIIIIDALVVLALLYYGLRGSEHAKKPAQHAKPPDTVPSSTPEQRTK
jgi:hypothetical protein